MCVRGELFIKVRIIGDVCFLTGGAISLILFNGESSLWLPIEVDLKLKWTILSYPRSAPIGTFFRHWYINVTSKTSRDPHWTNLAEWRLCATWGLLKNIFWFIPMWIYFDLSFVLFIWMCSLLFGWWLRIYEGYQRVIEITQRVYFAWSLRCLYISHCANIHIFRLLTVLRPKILWYWKSLKL